MHSQLRTALRIKAIQSGILILVVSVTLGSCSFAAFAASGTDVRPTAEWSPADTGAVTGFVHRVIGHVASAPGHAWDAATSLAGWLKRHSPRVEWSGPLRFSITTGETHTKAPTRTSPRPIE